MPNTYISVFLRHFLIIDRKFTHVVRVQWKICGDKLCFVAESSME